VIAADTSTWIAFLGGDAGWDVELLDGALKQQHVLMIPIVLAELCSDPKMSNDVEQRLSRIPLLQIEEGYWLRAGRCRAALLAKGRRARMADALIAQICIDAGILLVTRDRDFRAFAQGTKLVLATENT
jgi:predicted nucleic acid-binding protein